MVFLYDCNLLPRPPMTVSPSRLRSSLLALPNEESQSEIWCSESDLAALGEVEDISLL